MDLMQEITKPYLRKDFLSLQVGEKIKVTTKVFDKGNKEKYRISNFEGIIISQKRPKQINYNFAVLKEGSKLVIKQTFFYHSPSIINIKKMGMINQKVRQAKLYFLERELAAKKSNG
ncbi:15974_t:CDS:1 [Funneliformis geosporum]|uniref:15974_t:CDS:1 n=1 Tax=Funneliformis geosporum TaxID=1117311 RepID=A0A9W4SWE2_9GLOM|nr:15974_t:CDS:1 [Funneliformis geosporum]